LQRWPEALAAHERLATAVPATPQNLLLLGYVAFQAEEFAKAKAAWDAVLEREPEHKEAQQNMAVLRRQKPWLFPAQAT
jgi:cytochrome c-type biogenesis protein CcmH/NrfG